MRRFLVSNVPAPESSILLGEDEVRHARKVLRLNPGDRIIAIDGQGKAVLTELVRKETGFSLRHLSELQKESEKAHTESIPVKLGLALLKVDAMSLILQKAVELGAREILPFQAEQSVVQLKQKDETKLLERWNRITTQSLKQCERLQAPKVHLPYGNLFDLLEKVSKDETVLWFDEAAGRNFEKEDYLPHMILNHLDPPPSSILVLIGPEGGWAEEERALLSERYPQGRSGLGPLILRAETAAIFALSWVGGWLRVFSKTQSS
jgi:16S rRNA (uracil1498-N3)-methyltransferase